VAAVKPYQKPKRKSIMAVNDVYQLSADYKVRGEYCTQVFHYRESVECTDDVPAQSLAEAFAAVIIPEWAALVSSQLEFACLYCRRIRPTSGIAYTHLITTPGGVASEAIPSSSALVMSVLTNLATRRGRGRSYFGGLPETSQAGGSLESTVLADWQALGTLLLDPVLGSGGDTGEWVWGVYSRSAVAIQDALTYVVRTNLAQQRGRRQRPGTS